MGGLTKFEQWMLKKIFYRIVRSRHCYQNMVEVQTLLLTELNKNFTENTPAHIIVYADDAVSDASQQVEKQIRSNA